MSFLNGIIKFGLAVVLLGVAVAAFGTPEQPWLIDREPKEPVETVVTEEPTTEEWGYTYTPVVITWYGERIPKFKHELEPFKALGAAAYKPEQLQACENKSAEIRKSLVSKDKKFGAVVLCVRRTLKKPAPPVKEKK